MSKFIQELEEELKATESDIIALKKAKDHIVDLISIQYRFDIIRKQEQQKFILNNLSVFDLDDKTNALIEQLLTKKITQYDQTNLLLLQAQGAIEDERATTICEESART